MGLNPDLKIPLVGMVSRITVQKGFSYTIPALEGLLKKQLQVVLLGEGDSNMVQSLHYLKQKFPGNFAFCNLYQESLAHQIEAGSDFFLMPSLFEPCGLNQLYSLRYGTAPIVRSVGGLKGTVVNYNPQKKSIGTGFVFDLPTSEAVYNTTMWAVDVYKNEPVVFQGIIARGMKENFNWDQACQKYQDFYHSLF